MSSPIGRRSSPSRPAGAPHGRNTKLEPRRKGRIEALGRRARNRDADPGDCGSMSRETVQQRHQVNCKRGIEFERYIVWHV